MRANASAGMANSPVMERLFANAVADGDCWIWTGHKTSGGYGRTKIGERLALAHRWSYEAFVGEIPDGLVLDHLCRRRDCINPWHLEPVTQRVNTLRGEGLAAGFARQESCARGHEFNDENTYLYMGRRYCRPCKREYMREYSRTHPRGNRR